MVLIIRNMYNTLLYRYRQQLIFKGLATLMASNAGK